MRIFHRLLLVQLLVLLVLSAIPAPLIAKNNPTNEALSISGDPVPLRAGEKLWIDRDHYIVGNLDKAAKIGNNIFIVEIFDKNHQRLVDYAVKGQSDMPSMRGAHDSGVKSFALSNKGKFLLPVAVVMPGDWAVHFTISKDDKVIFNGVFFFNV